MKKIFLILSIIFLFSINLIASVTLDVIYLKNGNKLKGQIYKDFPNDYLQLELKDGSIIKINYTDINKKEVEETDEYIPFEQASVENNSKFSSSLKNFIPKGLDIYLNTFNFDYSEHLTLPNKSTEKGIINGINLSFTSNRNNDFWVNLYLDYSGAEEDYDGSTQLGVPAKAKTNSTFLRINANLYYTVFSSENFRIAPYIGYDIRSWNREVKGNGGVEEMYSWQNIPIGLRVDCPVSKKFNVGFLAQLNLMINGRIKILFSNYDPRYPDLILNLGKVPAMEFILPIGITLTDKITFNICPFYEKYEFDRSNSFYDEGKEILYEPASTTFLIGAKTGFTLLF